MQVDNKLLDDLTRVVSGAMGTVLGMRDEVEAQLRQQFERVLARMDLVSREEFEAVRAMAAKARDEQETLAARLAALEARAEAGAAPRTRRSAAATAGKAPAKAAGKTAAAKSGGPARKPKTRTGG